MHNILIVEDDIITRQILVDFVSNNNNVFQAENGYDALELLKNENTDIIITDLVMPEIEGIELILKIRQEYPKIKIIAISGKCFSGERDYLSMAAYLGADVTLSKPVNREVLMDSIKKIMY